MHTELHLLMFYYSLKWTFLKLEKQKKCSTITCAKHLTLRSAWQMFPALLQVFPVIWLKAKPNCMCRSSMTSSSTGCSMSMTSKTDSDILSSSVYHFIHQFPWNLQHELLSCYVSICQQLKTVLLIVWTIIFRLGSSLMRFLKEEPYKCILSTS